MKNNVQVSIFVRIVFKQIMNPCSISIIMLLYNCQQLKCSASENLPPQNSSCELFPNRESVSTQPPTFYTIAELTLPTLSAYRDVNHTPIWWSNTQPHALIIYWHLLWKTCTSFRHNNSRTHNVGYKYILYERSPPFAIYITSPWMHNIPRCWEPIINIEYWSSLIFFKPQWIDKAVEDIFHRGSKNVFE